MTERAPLTAQQILDADLDGEAAIILFLRYGHDRGGKPRSIEDVAKLVGRPALVVRSMEIPAYAKAAGRG